MTPARLLYRNLLYHWRDNLAVLLGVAVGTAVLTGALLIGDSQRGSLRELALHRLGWVDQALTAPRFFREALADELKDSADHVCPALLLSGSVSTSTDNRPRMARKVTILGVDDRFLPKVAHPWLGKPGSMDKVVFLNAPLARALDVKDGAEVTLHLQKQKEGIPRETLLGRKEAGDVEQTITLKATVLPEDAPYSEFTLMPGPQSPRNAFVPLGVLQDRLSLEGRVNGLLAGGPHDNLEKELARRLTLADWDLQIVRSRRGDYLSLESRRMILEPAIVDAIEKTKLAGQPTFIYLANNLADAARVRTSAVSSMTPSPLPLVNALTAYYGPSQVPYSAIAAVDLSNPVCLLEKALKEKVPQLRDDEIILTKWDGDPLKATTGDSVVLTWFRPEGAQAGEQSRVFRVAAVLPLRDVLADRNLVPQVRGITDRLPSNWDAPFPFDRTLIRPEDDRYWNRYGTTPKAYINLKTGLSLWGSRFGNLTSFRFVPPEGPNPDEAVSNAILSKLKPSDGGFVFESIKANALQASSGGTDFAMLFLGFSFFLILSALLLVGLLFRLSLDRRTEEVGVLIASGLRLRTIRRLLLIEGCVVALIGGLAGTAAAIFYGDVLLGRLRVWWPGGLDASTLQLFVTPLSLAIGYVAAFMVSGLTILWAVRALGKMTPRSLIQGQTTDELTQTVGGKPRRSLWVLGIALVGAIGCLIGGNFVSDHEARAGTFFGSGMLLLTAGLAALSAWMRGSRHSTVSGRGAGAVGRLGVRNASRHPVRSLLTAGLLGAAAFLLVGVESFRREPGQDYLRKEGGSGGYALIAESDLPIFQDLNSEAGRNEMLSKLEVRWNQEPNQTAEAIRDRLDRASVLLAQLDIVAFRVHRGDDASCLNLYQPRTPTLMSVPDRLINDGGFSFSSALSDKTNPWQTLRAAGDDIPVIGEQNTVTWMLKSGLGKTLTVPDWQGQDRELQVAALLQDSVFQNGLLMSEKRFLELYPDSEGRSFFLIRAEPTQAKEVKALLETALWDRGFEVTPAADRLASFLAVENMYLSTFQALGGMGLLLGTLGLAVVLLRSVWERRAELALLRALGYRRGTIGWLVLAENSFLLLLGLGLGTLTALVSVAPQALGSGGHIAWAGLLGMLGLSLLAGLAASSVATAATVRAALIPALRRE
jgi:ABC-type antimicrobial peptide transport system permease subunit